MAEILIKAQDDGTPGGWSRGDPIAIEADGTAWGALEGDPAVSYVVEITDATPEQLARYLAPRVDPATPDPWTGAPTVVAPRRYYAHGTPLDWQTELASTGRIVRTWAEVRGYIWDRDTGLSEAGVELS